MINNIKSTLVNYSYNRINFRLIMYVIIITIIGILSIGSAEGDYYRSKQTVGLALGLIVMVTLMLISYKFVMKFYWPLYFLTILLLIAVEIFGKINLGAERWIEIGGFQFQPSEICKIFLIIFLATYLNKHKERISTFKVLVPLIGLMALPLILILMQPDLSTTIVIFTTICVIIYLSGIHRKIVSAVLLTAVPVIAILCYIIIYHPEIQILHSHQYDRIVGFYSNDKDDPEVQRIRYQQENALLAIGSGGLTGKGLYNDDETSVKNGNLLPESHTDFIFTIIGEELGFVGAVSVIVLLFLIIFESFITGTKTKDFAGKLYCYGFGSLVGIQSFVNISVNTMLLPNTGLTLPFVSYGLTSLISLFIGVGIVLNIGLQTKKYTY